MDKKYDKIKSCDIIQDFATDKYKYYLNRHIDIEDGTSVIKFTAFRSELKSNKWVEISINEFNNVMGTDYKNLYPLPYEVLINIDIGQDFFKDSIKFLNEEVEVYNVLCKEVEKTQTRIATTQHYQTGDITSHWQPAANMYNVQTISVGGIDDLFTLLPGDKEHAVFEHIQGNLRENNYINVFKFCDYQIIQMANLSPATFGYEKDAYQNTTSVDLSMNLTEMTIEAIKKQIEPQINHLIENIVKLQTAKNIKVNEIPTDLVWDYGNNEKLTDEKKIRTLQSIQRAMAIPYETRAKILTPVLNKLIDEKTDAEELTKAYKEESRTIKYSYEEF